MESKKCICPYCENELKLECLEPIFCKPCNIKLIICPNCGGLASETSDKCPHCGMKL